MLGSRPERSNPQSPKRGAGAACPRVTSSAAARRCDVVRLPSTRQAATPTLATIFLFKCRIRSPSFVRRFLVYFGAANPAGSPTPASGEGERPCATSLVYTSLAAQAAHG